MIERIKNRSDFDNENLLFNSIDALDMFTLWSMPRRKTSLSDP